MGLLMNSASVLVFLMGFVNCVAADSYYIAPTVGGIVGLVSYFMIFFFMLKIKFYLFLDHPYCGYNCCC